MIAFFLLVAAATAAPSELPAKAPLLPVKQAEVKPPTTPRPKYPVPVCEDGYVRIEGLCYKFFSGNALTWEQAEAECVKDGGHLPTVLSKWEAMELEELAGQKTPLTLENQPWVGYFFNKGRQQFADGSTFFRGIELAGGVKREDGLCGKIIISKAAGGEGELRQLVQVKCETTSTSFFCKKRNCPKATSEVLPLGGCACKRGFLDIMNTLTPEENYRQKYQRGEYCIPLGEL